MTERDANNRKIAEFLGKGKPSCDRIGGCLHVNLADIAHKLERQIECKCDNWSPPNFYTDESANAMLLDAMPYPTLEVRYPLVNVRLWACFPDGARRDVFQVSADRKTAICEAFIAWKEKP